MESNGNDNDTHFFLYKNRVYKNHRGSFFAKFLAKMGKDIIFIVLFMIKMIEQDEIMILSV